MHYYPLVSVLGIGIARGRYYWILGALPGILGALPGIVLTLMYIQCVTDKQTDRQSQCFRLRKMKTELEEMMRSLH